MTHARGIASVTAATSSWPVPCVPPSNDALWPHRLPERMSMNPLVDISKMVCDDMWRYLTAVVSIDKSTKVSQPVHIPKEKLSARATQGQSRRDAFSTGSHLQQVTSVSKEKLLPILCINRYKPDQSNRGGVRRLRMPTLIDGEQAGNYPACVIGVAGTRVSSHGQAPSVTAPDQHFSREVRSSSNRLVASRVRSLQAPHTQV